MAQNASNVAAAVPLVSGGILAAPKGTALPTDETTALNAAFYRGTGLIHVGYYRNLSENHHCKRIMISTAEYQKLVAFINSSFEADVDGKAVVIENAAYGNNDSFYEAKGKYNLFYTCNSWANNALRSSGQKAALWTLTDTGIFCHYE